MRNKATGEILVKIVLCLLLSSIAGLALLVLVYLLPVKGMESHVLESIEIFYTEGVYPQVVSGYKGSQLDNETDAIMILKAIYPGKEEGVFEKALSIPSVAITGEFSGCRSLVAYLWEGVQTDGVSEYGRYWHGYLVILKPLLILFNYADIRYLNMFAQFFLLAYVLVLMMERGMKKYLISLLTAIMIVNPVATAMSMQFSSVYYVSLLSCIFLLKKKAWLEKDDKRYYYFFFIIGIATSYFDFLTYPTASLTMPLVLVLLMERLNLKEAVKRVIILSLFWGTGYIGMWMMKWVIYYIVLHYNIFAEILARVQVHTGEVVVSGEELNTFEVAIKNLKVFARSPYLMLGTAIVVYFLVKERKNIKKACKNVLYLIPFFMIAVIPIIWLMLTKNHAGWLYWYTSRGLMGMVFSLISSVIYITEYGKE